VLQNLPASFIPNIFFHKYPVGKSFSCGKAGDAATPNRGKFAINYPGTAYYQLLVLVTAGLLDLRQHQNSPDIRKVIQRLINTQKLISELNAVLSQHIHVEIDGDTGEQTSHCNFTKNLRQKLMPKFTAVIVIEFLYKI
jgi:hypothetical protein